MTKNDVCAVGRFLKLALACAFIWNGQMNEVCALFEIRALKKKLKPTFDE